VIVARFDREALSGFVSPQTYLSQEGLELLTTVGTIVIVPYGEVKTVSFVRDFDQGEPRRELRQFTTRPKMEGLWVRLRFRDGDAMDGLLPNNLLQLQLEPYGFTLVPPDPGFRNQRVFVPKAALTEVQVLGVVGMRKGRKPKPVPVEQISMFDKG
jgi:hypothetical protein